MTDMRTALGKVRGLGSSHEGTEHFWQSRLTSIASIPLTLFFIGLLVALNGAGYEQVTAALSNPIVALVMLMLILTNLYHMKLGLQVVIEDYVHAEAAKISLLILNSLFTIAIGITMVFAIMKLAFGG
jgi:succinate dehydrogenase / fumarate reductase membrane anchor subunit